MNGPLPPEVAAQTRIMLIVPMHITFETFVSPPPNTISPCAVSRM